MMRRRRALIALFTLPGLAAAGESAIRPGRLLSFPRDHGAHPETRTEWWYVTGWLADEGASEPAFGFQVTFFRSRTGISPDHPSRFAAQQLVFAHAALTDLQGRRLRHDQRIARDGFDIAATARDDTRVVLRGWRLEREGPTEASRYRASLASVKSNPKPATWQGEPLLQPAAAGGLGRADARGPRPGRARARLAGPRME
jgi:predicted secreted hydrolase